MSIKYSNQKSCDRNDTIISIAAKLTGIVVLGICE